MKIKMKSKDCGRLTSEHYTVMNHALTLQITDLDFESEDGKDYVFFNSIDDLQKLFSIPGLEFMLEVSNKG